MTNDFVALLGLCSALAFALAFVAGVFLFKPRK